MKIEHPSLCKILDTGIIHDPYIVTEYIDGVILSDYIDGNRFFTASHFAELLRLYKHILEALQALHKYDIFYGDVSPSNIMVSKTGQVYLIDYTECNYNNTKAPNKTMVIYQTMSPERGALGNLDYRSDIYEAGSILENISLKCLTALKNFYINETNIYDTMIFSIIKKATQTEPDERYQSIAEMLTDIDMVLKNSIHC